LNPDSLRALMGLDMNDPQSIAALDSLHLQLDSLELAIAYLLKLTLAQPQGSLIREQLLDRVSAFDSIADRIRAALDCMPCKHNASLM